MKKIVIGISLLLLFGLLFGCTDTKVIYKLDELSQKIDALEIENAALREDINTLNYNILINYNEINDATTRLNDIDSRIDTSLRWIWDNSDLTNPTVEAKISSCVSGCTINLNCISEKNVSMGLEYINDTNETNFLISIDQFFKDGGGDCEDYSLFFLAEYNHLRQSIPECKKITNKDDLSGTDFITDGNIYLICAVNDTNAHCLNYIVGATSGTKYYIEPQYGSEDSDFAEVYTSDAFIYGPGVFELSDFSGEWFNYGQKS